MRVTGQTAGHVLICTVTAYCTPHLTSVFTPASKLPNAMSHLVHEQVAIFVSTIIIFNTRQSTYLLIYLHIYIQSIYTGAEYRYREKLM